MTPVITPNYSSLHQTEINTFIKSIFWENLDTLEELQVGSMGHKTMGNNKKYTKICK